MRSSYGRVLTSVSDSSAAQSVWHFDSGPMSEKRMAGDLLKSLGSTPASISSEPRRTNLAPRSGGLGSGESCT